MCELLGLFFDLAEAAKINQDAQVAELQKYKSAYTKKIERDKKTGD